MASELTPEDVGKMKVADLRAELKARDLSTTGLKKELVDRLLEHLSSGTEGGEAAAASNGAEATGAAPDNGADVPESAAPSGDSTAQTAAEAAPVQASTEEASTDNLPGEMPAIPPVTEDSVDDFTGAEGTIAEETATVGVEKSNEPSEVVHPHPDHLDKIPGFVADSKSEEAREKAEVVPLNESAVLPGHDEASHKRKHDDLEEPVMSAPESAVKSVAEQEESSAPANDEITADPAAASILNGAPEAKRPRTDEAASNDDIAVPQETSSLAVEDVSAMPLDASTNGASASTFPTSVITPGINESTSMPSGGASSIGNTPDVVTLNEPQKPAVDFASAAPGEAIAASTNGAADASAVGSETKSVQMCFRPSHASFFYISFSAPPCLPPLPWYRTDHLFTIAGSSKEAQDTTGGVSSTARSLDEQDASSSHLSSSTSLPKDTKTQMSNQNNVAIPSTSTSTTSISTNKSSTPTLPAQNADQQQQNGPPVSRSICISNLVRPFTLPALKEKLEDFGEMDYFWINSIKSHCFVTYQSIDIAQQASQSLEGEVWPEAVGKSLSVTYLPSEKIASLVEKEQAAGRTRLELVTSFDSESNEWQYDVVAPIAAAKSLGQAPPVPRGLASSLPFQARVAAPAAGPSGPGRLDPRNMVTATSASGAAIRLPSNSAFAQSRPPVSRSAGPSGAPESSTDSGKPWLPKAGAEDLYHKTKTAPELYYRAVDKVAAGRRLREVERGPYVPRPGAGDRRAGPPASSYRDRYRP